MREDAMRLTTIVTRKRSSPVNDRHRGLLPLDIGGTHRSLD